MNYDRFEREILGYQDEMCRRAERSRILWTGSTPGHETCHPARVRLSVGLRSLADRLHAPPAHLTASLHR